jgi:7-carboxy-7-deazaguanine synthase
MDLKCPSSKMMKKNLFENLKYLKPFDEVKFVIGTIEDYNWTKEIIKEYELEKNHQILLSCVFGVLEPFTLVNWILEDKLKVRFQLQLHKYIWEPTATGV